MDTLPHFRRGIFAIQRNVAVLSETGRSPMKPTTVEHSAVEHAPFSTVVCEQSLPDRQETGPDGQPRLLPRETFHHVYLQDTATGSAEPDWPSPLRQTIARDGSQREIEARPACPPLCSALGELRYAAWFTDADLSLLRKPSFPKASGRPPSPFSCTSGARRTCT